MLVIICVDNSDHSKHAMEFYLKTLHKPGNTIKVLHCQEDWSHIGVMEGPSPATVQEMRADTILNAKQSEEHAKDVFGNNQVEYQFLKEKTDEPWEAIVKVAKAQGAGLIVIGTRGLGKIRRTILGSTSTSVVHHAHCPVVVCPMPKKH